MSRTVTLSIATVLIAGALAVAATGSVTPSFAREGSGGHGGGGGPVIQGGGGAEGGVRGAVPGGGVASGGKFSSNGASGMGHVGTGGIHPAAGIGGGQFAHDGGHRHHHGNGGYNGYLDDDGWNYGFNG